MLKKFRKLFRTLTKIHEEWQMIRNIENAFKRDESISFNFALRLVWGKKMLPLTWSVTLDFFRFDSCHSKTLIEIAFFFWINILKYVRFYYAFHLLNQIKCISVFIALRSELWVLSDKFCLYWNTSRHYFPHSLRFFVFFFSPQSDTKW